MGKELGNRVHVDKYRPVQDGNTGVQEVRRRVKGKGGRLMTTTVFVAGDVDLAMVTNPVRHDLCDTRRIRGL
jgi:hypothetical protein